MTGLVNLKRLNLDSTGVTDQGLATVGKFKNLAMLHLGSTTVTDKGLQKLAGLKQLKQLMLTFCAGVTDEGVEQLQQALSELNDIQR